MAVRPSSHARPRNFATRANRALPPLLPEAARERLRVWGRQLLALLIAGSGLMLVLALASYAPTDPSWNSASSLPVRNLLGTAGAVAADLCHQSVGHAAWLVAAIFLCWGWVVWRRGAVGWLWARLLALLGAVAALTIATTALLPAAEAWPAPGGMLGTMLLSSLMPLVELVPHSLLGATIIAIPCAVVMLFLFYVAAGVALGEWGDGMRLMTGQLQALWATLRGWSARPAARPEQLMTEADDDDAATEQPPTRPSPDAPRRRPARPRSAKVPARQLALGPGSDALPDLDLLQEPPVRKANPQHSPEALERGARLLENVLLDFGVQGQIVRASPGPVVTLYELEPAPGTKSSRVVSLADDIARSMSATAARVAVVPGRNVIGIELPNPAREMVYLRELLDGARYRDDTGLLTLALGKDIGGEPIVADLARMPHLLVAGTTGSGKSVAINTMILSLLYRLRPEQCRLILIDPKMLELSVYEGIPHLLTPVVTEPKKAIVALKWTVREMENRYRAMSVLGVRNIEGYNNRVREAAARGEVLMRRVQTGFTPATGQPIFEEQPLDLVALPAIVVIVDEMADLMLVAGKEIEAAIQRLSQMARAAGIHLIMATQRPSVDVITGTIKANFPTRISFQVSSKIDSRTILGEAGAEQLLGQGDMLYMAGGGRVLRVHGPFVADREVEAVVRFLRAQGTPDYRDEVTAEEDEAGDLSDGEGGNGSGDALYQRAVELVLREGKASTSFVQRHLQIGYNRAARIIDQMEAAGIVGPANHVGKREVLGRGGH